MEVSDGSTVERIFEKASGRAVADDRPRLKILGSGHALSGLEWRTCMASSVNS